MRGFQIISLLLSGWLLAACTADITTLECDPGGEDTRVLPDSRGEVAGDLLGEVAPSGPGLVGEACEQASGCASGECLTRESMEKTAASAGQEWLWDIPGGMCSRLMCNLSPTDPCGEGAFCLDVTAAFGSGIPVGLCLHRCEEYSDCRFQEGYVCYFTGVEGQRACLPGDLVAAIPCGNGACDADKGETRDTCPRDCP